MVRAYSFIPLYYTLVIIPLLATSFSIFRRMEEDFMGLYLVRKRFQSDMCLVRKSESLINTFLFCLQKDDNLKLCLVSNSKVVEIGRMQPSRCTVIFAIYGVNTKYNLCHTKIKVLSMLFISCRLHTRCI